MSFTLILVYGDSKLPFIYPKNTIRHTINIDTLYEDINALDILSIEVCYPYLTYVKPNEVIELHAFNKDDKYDLLRDIGTRNYTFDYIDSDVEMIYGIKNNAGRDILHDISVIDAIEDIEIKKIACTTHYNTLNTSQSASHMYEDALLLPYLKFKSDKERLILELHCLSIIPYEVKYIEDLTIEHCLIALKSCITFKYPYFDSIPQMLEIHDNPYSIIKHRLINHHGFTYNAFYTKLNEYVIQEMRCMRPFNIINNIEKSLLNNSIYIESVKLDPNNLKCIRNDLNEYIVNSIIEYDGMLLGKIDKKHHSKELYNRAIINNPNSIKYMITRYMTMDLVKISMKYNVFNLKHVPNKFKSYNIYKHAFISNGSSLKYFTNTYKFNRMHLIELYSYATNSDSRAIEFVPREYQTYYMCINVLRRNKRCYYHIIDKHNDYIKIMNL